MYTGDLAVMDEEGTVTIEGRSKDMVIRGGENIYPKEVEDFLYRHPFVRDVQVVGLPDTKYGEELCAWIVLNNEAVELELRNSSKGNNSHQQHAIASAAFVEESIRAFCKQKLSHYKVPRYIHFAEEFPLTVTGKVKKYEMREASLSIFGIKK